jgi:hypothetical protein
MNTLLLDTQVWDLVLDSFGNIAIASDPYSISQDVTSALKTFTGEVYFDSTLGVPYNQSILGQLPPVALLKTYFIEAALAVPEVATAQVLIQGFTNRGLTAQLQFITTSGQSAGVTL